MTCKDCKERATCQKVCQKMEAFLRKEGIYRAGYIRPRVSSNERGKGDSPYREIPFSSLSYEVQKELGVDQEFSNYNPSPKEEEDYI